MWHELPSRCVVLGHEGEAVALLAGDLLGAQFEQAVFVGTCRRASVYLKAISCCPKLHSPFTDSTTMPAARIERRIRPSRGSIRAVPWIE